MILVVTYDLHAPGRDYAAIEAVLKRARSWAHPQGSVWLLDTNDSPQTWVSALKQAGDVNDEYFVARLSHNWWSQNMDREVIDWLKSPARSW